MRLGNHAHHPEGSASCWKLSSPDCWSLSIAEVRDPEFVNVVVLKGDQIKEVDEDGGNMPDCPSLIASLLGSGTLSPADDQVSVLVQLGCLDARARSRRHAAL